MRPAQLSPLFAVVGVAAGFWLGRISGPGPEKAALTTNGTPGASSQAMAAANSENGKPVEPGSGLASAEALDPSITIDSLMATAANEPPGLARFALLHEALLRITPKNWHGAMVTMWKARSEGKISDQEMRYVLQRLGEAAGAVALEGFKPKDPVNGWETHSGRFAMMGWAMKDPTAAKAWLETQPAGKYRDGMAWGFVLGMGLRDAPAALRTMQALEPSEQKRLLSMALNDSDGTRYAALAEAWLTANNTTGASKVREQTDDVTAVFDNLLNAQILSGWVEKKNDKFHAWVDGLDRKPWFGPQGITRVAMEFVRRDETSGAMTWIERFASEQPAAAKQAIQATMAQWSWKDPEAAATWLNQNGTSPNYDQAVSAFLTAQRNRVDAETARAWANSIHDDTLRAAHLKQIR